MHCTIPFYHKIRRNHDKFYEFVINIRDEQGVCRIIHRRYNQFFNFQHELLKLFPTEAGTQNPQDRLIPILPGKILFRTEKERQIAANRRPLLEAYCTGIFQLPAFIRRHRHVVQFFACTDEDVKKTVQNERALMTSYEISAPEALALRVVTQDHVSRDAAGREFAASAGETAAVLRRTDTGYWLVDIGGRVGWLPAEFLATPTDGIDDATASDNPTSDSNVFVCVRSFDDDEGGRVAILTGDLVVALERRSTGWWTVRREFGQQRSADASMTAPAVNLRLVDPRFIDRRLLLLNDSQQEQGTLRPVQPLPSISTQPKPTASISSQPKSAPSILSQPKPTSTRPSRPLGSTMQFPLPPRPPLPPSNPAVNGGTLNAPSSTAQIGAYGFRELQDDDARSSQSQSVVTKPASAVKSSRVKLMASRFESGSN